MCLNFNIPSSPPMLLRKNWLDLQDIRSFLSCTSLCSKSLISRQLKLMTIQPRPTVGRVSLTSIVWWVYLEVKTNKQGLIGSNESPGHHPFYLTCLWWIVEPKTMQYSRSFRQLAKCPQTPGNHGKCSLKLISLFNWGKCVCEQWITQNYIY